MPAKSKVSKTDWHECVKCKCLVIGRDLVKHTEDCEKVEQRLFSYGYIQDDCLHGVVSPLTIKEGEKYELLKNTRFL